MKKAKTILISITLLIIIGAIIAIVLLKDDKKTNDNKINK